MENFKIGIINIDFETMIDEQINEKCRNEAKIIVDKSIKLSEDDNQFKLLLCELYVYHKESKGNIFCLHLDFLKSKLIEKGLIEEDGCFGKPF
jgi:hypothetical protein